ncbi:MAG: hypothetical protein ACOC8F_01370 [Planctomycetota bacterium]
MTWALSDNHRRGISSTLALLDEMLCRFERWANCEAAEGVLYQERDTLSRRQRQRILNEIAALRRVLTELHDSLGLEVKTQDVASAIWSQSSAYWEALVELGSKHLRRYGDMPEGFAGDFDPKVEQIVRHMMCIGDAASHRRPTGR